MNRNTIPRSIIEALPRDTLYVVPINFQMLAAAVRLAVSIDRADVTFVTPLFLSEDSLAMLPKRRPVEVHPSAHLEPEQQRVLAWYTSGGRDGTAAA